MFDRVPTSKEVARSNFNHTVELMRLCVVDRKDSVAWSEFVRCIFPKLRYFIRGTLHRSAFGPRLSLARVFPIENNVEDLIQTTIVRLVENDCAVLRRFAGKTENDLFAYLAVISRSVVQDGWRRQHALKRSSYQARRLTRSYLAILRQRSFSGYSPTERQILAQELLGLAQHALDDDNHFSKRDRLIFNLYFFNDMSAAQIAQCRSIGLTKAGVERVLSRVKNRTRTMAGAGPSEVGTKQLTPFPLSVTP
jgi:RNA polymerase sigma factor (sigma-70 family)